MPHSPLMIFPRRQCFVIAVYPHPLPGRPVLFERRHWEDYYLPSLSVHYKYLPAAALNMRPRYWMMRQCLPPYVSVCIGKYIGKPSNRRAGAYRRELRMRSRGLR